MQPSALWLSVCTSLLVACQKPHDVPKPPPDPTDIPGNIDAIATKVLAESGVPSASVAAVVDGKIVYVHAYGDGRIEPKRPASPQMRYSIGSISKQLTATAILLLAEDGKLSLDDHVEQHLPGLTRGNDITLRQLLSHTSGYPDYAPQDYIVPEWQQPISAEQILTRWAKVPLEFEPGTKYQYSNTNYVIAGQIVERISGMQLVDFLGARVFKQLGMTSVTNSDRAKLTDADAQGTYRRALGPLHPAPHEGPGWMYAAGELAMTAEDLARWDISMIEQSILKPASYHQLETEVLLANGAGTRYGLGLSVGLVQGHRELRHGGEVSGYVSSNVVLPDDKIAIVVLTNQDAVGAADNIASQVKDKLLRAVNAPSQASDRRIRDLLDGLAAGRIDLTVLTSNAASYFTPAAVAEISASLAPLGPPERFEPGIPTRRGGMTGRRYTVTYAEKTVSISVYETDDGKIEQYLIESTH